MSVFHQGEELFSFDPIKSSSLVDLKTINFWQRVSSQDHVIQEPYREDTCIVNNAGASQTIAKRADSPFREVTTEVVAILNQGKTNLFVHFFHTKTSDTPGV